MGDLVLNTSGNERLLLAAMIKEPRLIYDIATKITTEHFNTDSHRFIFDIIRHSVMEDKLNHLDKLTILAQGEKLNIRGLDRMTSNGDYIDSLTSNDVNKNAIPVIVDNIQKAFAQRRLRDHFKAAANKIESGVTDKNETTQELVASMYAETMDEVQKLCGVEGVGHLGKDIDNFLKETKEMGGESNFIPIHLMKWNRVTGGGLRKIGLNVIAARPKVGKSTLSDEIVWHMGMTKKIPALILDTEMNNDFHRTMLLARESEIPRGDIESGMWNNTSMSKERVEAAANKLKESPIFYKSAAGLTMPEVVILIREFIHRYVGLDAKGFAKNCVVVYDFLHLTSLKGLSNNVKEYQVLGHYLTMLRTVAIQYRIPIVLVVQLNREGRDEDYGTASGTDRIEWYCSSMTILRKKTPEEVFRDGVESGNVKARVVYSRYGEGHDTDDYLNLRINYPIGKISEGKTNRELSLERKDANNAAEKPDGPKEGDGRTKRGRSKKHQADPPPTGDSF
jgi:replicative DNA helicase